MYIKQATVNNQVGLHARPATFFIQKANEFKSTIWVEKDDQRVNAKSLLGVLSLGIIKGSTIDLIADGTDEKEAVDALVELISSTSPTDSGRKPGLLHFPGKHHRGEGWISPWETSRKSAADAALFALFGKGDGGDDL